MPTVDRRLRSYTYDELLAENRQLRRKVREMRNCGNCAGATECADNGARHDCLSNDRQWWQMKDEEDVV